LRYSLAIAGLRGRSVPSQNHVIVFDQGHVQRLLAGQPAPRRESATLYELLRNQVLK
jgi:hypothetical protein